MNRVCLFSLFGVKISTEFLPPKLHSAPLILKCNFKQSDKYRSRSKSLLSLTSHDKNLRLTYGPCVYGAGVLVIIVTWRPLEAFISTYSSSGHRLTEQRGLVEPNQGVNFVTGQEQVKVQV